MSAADKKYALIAAVAYAATITALVWSLFVLRDNVLSGSNSAKAQGEWQKWRTEVERQQQEPRSVARHVPKSAEPPVLVLMRDYFVTCMVGAVVFVSLLYWVFVGLAMGVVAAGDLHVADSGDA